VETEGENGMSAAKSKGVVGIVGLGIMGGAFAKNLVAAGWRVVGYDVDPARTRAMAKLGVKIAKNAKSLAAEVPTIITSLPNPKALDLTVKAIIDAKVPRRVVVEASTFTLADKERAEHALRKAGHVMLDTPVSGTGAQAQNADLVFYASGDKKSIAKLMPLFADFGRKAYDLGAFGNGSKMKYIANHLVAINNVAAAEAMVLGMKAGLDPQIIFETISSGAGNSRIFELRAPMMVANRYDQQTMKMSVWQKDMKVIGEFAKQIHCPTPMFDTTLPIYAAAMKSGLEDQDTAAVCAVMESMAKFKRKLDTTRRKKR
jgi:3-hydroxyisobutyrate dehydrogenase-like beta-hydroxyacid dehydrogenase